MSHPPTGSSLTRSVEDYLKAIYHLSARSASATTSDIAEELGVAPASVTGMVKRLSESALVEHEPYHGVRLTDVGRRAALRTIRRHRVLETYLIAKLGYDWASVHEEAERLEHAVSDTLVDRMADALGNPRYDPHGDPIPTADGIMEETVWFPLDQAAVGESVWLRQVRHGDPERLRYLDRLGLHPGTLLTVVERQPFNGPTTVRLTDGASAGDGSEREHTIGRELALGLLCSAEEQ